MTAGELKDYLKSEDAIILQDGKVLDDDCLLDDKKIAVVKVVPGELATVLAIVGIVVGLVGLGIAIYTLCNTPSTRKVQVSPSLRGSTNSARKDLRLPILLGRHRVYPDVASLPFSTYASNEQYLHQLFCFGYSDVSIDESTLKVGESLLSNFTGVEYTLGLGTIYPNRVVEIAYGIELKNNGTATAITRTTATRTWKIHVGIIAPNGLYRYDKKDRETVSVGVKVEWRVPEGVWNIAYNQTITQNVDAYRNMIDITPSGSPSGTYEVRVTRTNAESTDSAYIDSIYLDVIKSFTQNENATSALPVADASKSRLLSLKIKASNQLNGVVDDLNAICTLSARAWDTIDSGADHWSVGATRNPASAILYLLTSASANPSPVNDNLIDWPSFEGFYSFCETNGLHCDAWVTGDFTIRQLCEYIAQSCMAEFQVQCDRIKIRIDEAQAGVVQLFTPRNAWDLEMTRSFEDKPANLTVKFNDASSGYVEVERLVSVDSDLQIVFDSKQDGENLQVDTFGITEAEHASKLGALRLKQLHARSRTFSWKSDIEGIVCIPGDVVLLENDNFLLGLGEGRITKYSATTSGITAITLDNSFRMVAGKSYGIRIRTSAGTIIDSWAVNNSPGSRQRIRLAIPLPLAYGVSEGDLVAFGEFQSETIKVLVTEVTPDQNRSCSFKGVDYAEDVYSAVDSIPAFHSGISKYPDDGSSVGSNVSKYTPKSATAFRRSALYLGKQSAIPSGFDDEDFFLYTGLDITGFSYGHIYKYSKGTNQWMDIPNATYGGSMELAAASIDAQALEPPTGTSSDWKCHAAEEFMKRCVVGKIDTSTILPNANNTSSQERFDFRMEKGVLNQEGTEWEQAPQFYIRSGDGLLLGVDGRFVDTADNSRLKRALVNGAGTFALTDKRVYARNLIANGLAADDCSLHGNISTEILINPALICQPSSRGVTQKYTSKTQNTNLAFLLCLWARDQNIPFDTLVRFEVGAESSVGWAKFHTDRSIAGMTAANWDQPNEIACYVYLYQDDGDYVYSLKSICTERSYEEQNTWIFGLPWFGTHAVYYWAREGGLYGEKNCYVEEAGKGIGGSVPPVNSINPSDYAIVYTGYGEFRNNTGGYYTGFRTTNGGTIWFKAWSGSDYDLFMPKLPTFNSAADAQVHQVYLDSSNVLHCRTS